jgi:hypothetical protein
MTRVTTGSHQDRLRQHIVELARRYSPQELMEQYGMGPAELLWAQQTAQAPSLARVAVTKAGNAAFRRARCLLAKGCLDTYDLFANAYSLLYRPAAVWMVRVARLNLEWKFAEPEGSSWQQLLEAAQALAAQHDYAWSLAFNRYLPTREAAEQWLAVERSASEADASKPLLPELANEPPEPALTDAQLEEVYASANAAYDQEMANPVRRRQLQDDMFLIDLYAEATALAHNLPEEEYEERTYWKLWTEALHEHLVTRH